MRIRIAFKLVRARAQISEDLDRGKLVAFDNIDWHKDLNGLIQIQLFWLLLLNVWSSERAASFFGSIAKARSNSPSARFCNPNCLYNSASITRKAGLSGSRASAACNSVSAIRRGFDCWMSA